MTSPHLYITKALIVIHLRNVSFHCNTRYSTNIWIVFQHSSTCILFLPTSIYIYQPNIPPIFITPADFNVWDLIWSKSEDWFINPYLIKYSKTANQHSRISLQTCFSQIKFTSCNFSSRRQLFIQKISKTSSSHNSKKNERNTWNRVPKWHHD